jgi:hypothetical protein
MAASAATKTKVKPAPVVRTGAGLRDVLIDEIDAIRNGSSNPTRANAIAKLAAGVVDTVRMELEVQRHLRGVAGDAGSAPSMPSLGAPLSLGS